MIHVKNLTKKYGPVTAVDDLSFDITDNGVYGFLGPNGAGKSTTMNIITGCLGATSGTVLINGVDILDDPLAAKRSIGYLPELPPLYADMTPLEYLTFVAEAKGVSSDKLNRAVDGAIDKTSLGDASRRLIRNLSKGYKQRVGIAQALIGDPKIIILDEPTVGLDPLQIIEIRSLIAELGREHTVVLSSHILSEISAVCEYVMIMSRGRLVASDTIAALTESSSSNNLLRIESRGDAETVANALRQIDGVISLSVEPGGAGVLSEIEYPAGMEIRDAVFAAFSKMGAAILSMTTNRLTLEEVFIKLTRDSEYSQAGYEYRAEDKTDGVGGGSKNADGDEYTPLFSDKEDDEE